jgi:hypothetical protein
MVHLVCRFEEISAPDAPALNRSRSPEAGEREFELRSAPAWRASDAGGRCRGEWLTIRHPR